MDGWVDGVGLSRFWMLGLFGASWHGWLVLGCQGQEPTKTPRLQPVVLAHLAMTPGFKGHKR